MIIISYQCIIETYIEAKEVHCTRIVHEVYHEVEEIIDVSTWLNNEKHNVFV